MAVKSTATAEATTAIDLIREVLVLIIIVGSDPPVCLPDPGNTTWIVHPEPAHTFMV